MSRLYLQRGYRLHPKKRPFFDDRMTKSPLEQTGQASPVVFGSDFFGAA